MPMPPIVRHLLDRHPQAVLQGNNSRQLPIHVACKAGACLECIQLLQSLASECVERQCGSGLYPVHCACTQKDHSAVIQYLLDLFPDTTSHKDEDGELSLHILLRREWSFDAADNQLQLVNKFVSIYPGAVSTTNDENDLPFHLTCEYSKSLELVQRIVELNDGEVAEVYGDNGVQFGPITLFSFSFLIFSHN
jgi:hypothetical protein